MALQWMILTYMVAAEAALAFLLTLPAPKPLKNQFVSLVSLILQPALFIVPLAGFQLLDGEALHLTKRVLVDRGNKKLIKLLEVARASQLSEFFDQYHQETT